MGVVHLIFIFMLVIEMSLGQIIIPKKYDGFPLYNSKNKDEGSIMVEAFFDPLCPDSRDSWPPLKQALQYYSPHLSFIFHPFPLPYHSNAYIASLALHIGNNLNSSTTFPLLELFFKFQENYYNDPTFNMSRAMVTDDITNLAISLIGKSYSQAFKAGFQDPQTNEAQRVSFKYGCSRGVASTPTFLVNGFTLPGAGAAIPFQQWKSIIDPLLKNE